MEGSTDRRLVILAVFALVAAVVVAVILISRSGGGGGGSTSVASAAGCKQVEAPKPRQVAYKAPPQTVKRGEKLVAVLKTSCGSFDVSLATSSAPKTVNSFVYLTDHGFYNDLTFHRIAPGFVIQGGDPLGNGSGGPGYTVVEKPPRNLSYTRGTVAMAKSSSEPPGASGSQFFVVLGANAGLPPEYALLGHVSSGLDVVERIGRLGTPAQQPKQTILIEKASIVKHG